MPAELSSLRHRPPCRRPRRGATVMESVTGVALFVAVVGVALPNLDRTRHRLDGEVESLVLVMESAQRLALLRGYDLALTFDVVGNRIRLHHDRDADGAVDADEQIHDIPLRTDVAFGAGGARPLSAAAEPVTFTLRRGGRPAVIFRGDGTASESGFVHLAPRMPAGGPAQPEHARAIGVWQNTGAVSCLSYRTGRWEPSC